MVKSREERIRSNNKEFEAFISLIPQKYYYNEAPKNSLIKQGRTKKDSKYLKKLKLDPDSYENVEVIDKELSNEEKQPLNMGHCIANQENGRSGILEGKKLKKKEDKVLGVDSSISKKDNGVDDESLEDRMEGVTMRNGKNEDRREETCKKETTKKSEEKSADIFDLRLKLASRIEQLRANRKMSRNGIDSSAKNRDSILETRKKKNRDQKKISTKIKQKKALNDAQKQRNMYDGPSENNNISNKSEETSLMYGKIAFESDIENKHESGQKKRNSMDLVGAVRHLEAKKQRLSQLSDEKKKEVMISDAWEKAFLKSQGEKVKDNEALLKKSLKWKERRKKKSTKAWNERHMQLLKTKQLRQKKREENIKLHKTMQKKKPTGKTQRRPGFEGSNIANCQNRKKTLKIKRIQKQKVQRHLSKGEKVFKGNTRQTISYHDLPLGQRMIRSTTTKKNTKSNTGKNTGEDQRRAGLLGCEMGEENLSSVSNPRWNESMHDYRQRNRGSPYYQNRSRSWTPRRSYSPQNHSPSYRRLSRRRRSRSPLVTQGHRRHYDGRQAARNAMVNHIREASQQDRRVYIGNLSYDVKWHHLKDFMKQGTYSFHHDLFYLF
ncbi:hypothetical protein MERGE_001787 [Pneumocystis wakefieldiae]|uniref:Ribosomal RNA-processing protein 14/surfeit locus protein 6 C-terminal domain-containing protein n=1 Tax=Pneumocystis wakefieldiae TaxID=38082 RepID=A0A899FVU6_9ASCO|nr:hypothetical protein MERGE_001787 [Pneumocystis wakefieldiae]